MTSARLRPTTRSVFVVRWIRTDGRDVKHRYFSRRHDAETYAAKLRSYGKDPAVFRAATEWEQQR